MDRGGGEHLNLLQTKHSPSPEGGLQCNMVLSLSAECLHSLYWNMVIVCLSRNKEGGCRLRNTS